MKKSLCIVGIDPGISGALGFYFASHPELISAEDMPVVDGEVDVATLAARIRQMQPDMAVIERVGAMPKQGVSSTFKFGTSYGSVLGVVAALGVPWSLVSPAKWKRHFSLSSEKEQSRALALRLWPSRSELFELKRHHGRAEAALLARFGAETRKEAA